MTLTHRVLSIKLSDKKDPRGLTAKHPSISQDTKRGANKTERKKQTDRGKDREA